MKTTFLALLAALSLGTQAATTVTFTSIDGTAGITGTAYAGDGVFPGNGSFWQTDTAHWSGFDQAITFTFDRPYQITGLSLSVDNNDYYRLSLSTDKTTWDDFYTVLAFEGAVGSGVETFTPKVVSTRDFYRYARITALAGDSLNSVGELQFTGVAAAVPEPATTAMLLAGLGLVGMAAKRRRA